MIYSFFFVLSTLVGNGVAVDHDQRVKDFKALETVFGQHRLNTHFPTSSGSLQLQERKLSGSADDEVGMHIVCSAYSEATHTETMLTSKFGKNNVHPAYSSASENSVCFVTSTQYSEARQIKGNNLLHSVTSVPSSMKIHESVMFTLGLVDETDASYPTLKKLYGREKQTVNLEHTTLAISNGVGVKAKSIATGAGMRENDMKELLVNSPASTHLLKLAAASGREGTIWHSHLASADTATCNFESLSYEHTGHSMHIGNLHEIAKSEFSKTCFATLLASLASHPTSADIRFNTPKKTSNYLIKGIMQAEAVVTTYPYTNVGIDGTGQVVGIGDTGVDELSCFFRNADGSKVARSTYKNPTYDDTKRKVIQYINYADDTDTEGGHGTHVSGTVGGSLMYDSTTLLPYNGHASGAKIAFFDMEYSAHPEYGIRYPSPIGDKVFQPAYDAGARLHSNSWGGPFNLYDDDTLDIDDFSNTHVDFLALFAAGNDGSEGYYSLGDPAVSKNAISVGCSMSGSSGNMDKVAFFSSLGPTFDNRIKPDIIAPGYSTYSSKAAGSNTQTCSVVAMAGTSMATPAVAGAAAQIRQYFAVYDSTAMPLDDGCSYFTSSNLVITANTCEAQPNPRGATVKAMLINSGEAMGTYFPNGYDTTEPQMTLAAPPDMYQGFGRVSLQNVLPYPSIEDILEVHVVELFLNVNMEYVHTVTVGDNSRPFKATLVWMDPTNSAITAKMLINNLDLEVEETSTGTVYYGNGNGGDDTNNVEQVSISVPSTSGSYKVRVTAGSYLYGSSQSFSLVITGGDLTFSTGAKNSVSSGNNPLDCGTNERMVRLSAMDRKADGWTSGQKYRIAGTDNSFVLEGTMSGADRQDFLTDSSVCLPVGSYTASLVNTASSSDLSEMALEVTTCAAYLSEYQPSVSFSISSASSNYCGACTTYMVSLLLAGSFYGVPYGWKDDTHYELVQSSGGDKSYMGTLATGMVREHKYCLSDGTYTLGIKNVPKSDDFMDDDYLANYFGVEEYVIYFADSTGNSKSLLPSETMTITVSGGSGAVSISSGGGGGGDDDDSVSTGAAIGIAIAVIVVIGCCASAIVYFACCRKKDPLVTNIGMQGNTVLAGTAKQDW